jgi:hypothetical protein
MRLWVVQSRVPRRMDSKRAPAGLINGLEEMVIGWLGWKFRGGL